MNTLQKWHEMQEDKAYWKNIEKRKKAQKTQEKTQPFKP